MKLPKFGAVALVVGSAAAFSTALAASERHEKDPINIRELLVGKWFKESRGGIDVTMEFKEDGTFVSTLAGGRGKQGGGIGYFGFYRLTIDDALELICTDGSETRQTIRIVILSRDEWLEHEESSATFRRIAP